MRVLPAFAATLLCLSLSGAQGRAEDEVVTLTDGTRLRGKVVTSSPALLVRTGPRDVHVSPALVARRAPAPPDIAAVPEYRFHEAEAKARKKGAVALVVDKFAWNGPFTPDGTVGVSCTDPKLGPISFTLVVTSLTPTQATLEGVEYSYKLTYPTHMLGALVAMLVESRTTAAEPEGLFLAARFFRLAGDFDAASRWLDALAQAAPDHSGLADESARLESSRFLARLSTLRRLTLIREEATAHEMASTLAVSATLKAALPEETREFKDRAEALARRSAIAARVATLFHERNISGPAPDVAAAVRLAALLDAPEGSQLKDEWLRPLCGEWSEALVRTGFVAARVGDAVALANSVAEFFRQDKPTGVGELARALAASTLPESWKLAIVRTAATFVEPTQRTWQRIEYDHPLLHRTFHYFVQVPPQYRPDVACPALIVLHGQHGTADSTQAWWGKVADAWGLVLISPEYIYGRKDGYEFSTTEHQSVLGALWHASGWLHLDHDHVSLEGQSQGGHATWDLGSASAGTFAAVVPIIGAALSVKKHANFLDTALYVIDGSEDGGAPTYNRASIQALAKLRADARYIEYVGRKHEGFSEEYDDVCAWLLNHRRPEARRDVHLSVHVQGGGRRSFVEITGFQRAPPTHNIGQGFVAEVTAHIDAEGNRIEATARGVTQVRFWLSPALFDFAKPIQIVVNGKSVHEGAVKCDWERGLADAFTRRDRREVFAGQVNVGVK